MLSSSADPYHDVHVRVETLQDDGGDTNVSDQSDAESERELIAQHNLHARIFPPPLLRSSHPLAKSSASSASQSDVLLSPSASISPDSDALHQSWFRVVEARSKILALRDNLSKVRRQTRKARLEKDAVDNAFMSLLRPLRVTTPDAINSLGLGPTADQDISRLRDLLVEMQETRDRCQALEISLEAKEDELDTAQDELDHLERLLLKSMRPNASQLQFAEDAEVERVPMPEPLLGLSKEPTENYHPFYMRFMEALRDHDMFEEEYHDNLARKAEIEAQLYRSKLLEKYDHGHMQHTEQLDTWDQDFLRDFETEKENSVKRLARLRNEADSLRELCFEKRVVPRYADLNEVYHYYPWEFSVDPDPVTEPDEVRDVGATAYTTASRFGILLSNPFHLLEDEPVTATTALKMADAALAKNPHDVNNKKWRIAALKEFIIERLIHDARPGDKGNFINRWALHKLRISPGEVELLSSSFTDETGLYVHDVRRWQQDVLYCWPRDEAARVPPEQYKGALSRVAASSDGSISKSTLTSSGSIVPSDRTGYSNAPDTSSCTQDGDYPTAKDEDTADSSRFEVEPHAFSGETLEPLQRQDDIQFGALLAVPAREPQTLKPEAMVVPSPERLETPEPDTVHTAPSAQVQTFGTRLQSDLPLREPLSIDPGVLPATPAEEISVVPDDRPLQIEQPPTTFEEDKVLSEEPQSLDSQTAVHTLLAALPAPSKESQGIGSDAAQDAPMQDTFTPSEN